MGNIEELLVVFDKLTSSLISLIAGQSSSQDDARNSNLIFSLITYLQRAIDLMPQGSKVYNEGTVISVLNLLVNTVDQNKDN